MKVTSTMRNLNTIVLAAALALFALAVPAAGPLSAAPAAPQQHGVEAQTGAEAPHDAGAEHGEPGLFSGNLGNAVWTLVVFAVLLVFLGKFAWGPILSALQGREEFIRDSLEQAKTAREEAEARLAEYEAKLATARQEVDAMLEEGRRDNAAMRRREEEQAREETEKMLARARREIDIAKETAVKDLFDRATQLSVEVAGRILEREVSAADHGRLIDDAISALEGQDARGAH
jgi:F-type H+-transporting ATPase subunit b